MSRASGSRSQLQSVQEDRIQQQLMGLVTAFSQYEIKRNRELALEVVPIADLTQIAEAKQISSADAGNSGPDLTRDFLLLELLRWFKEEFFTWMDKPKCPRCSKVADKPVFANGQDVPTPNEVLNSASRVEVYSCSACAAEGFDQIIRFPRYNNPVVLLQTRTGRCGEWANCFALICRAMDFEVRHVTEWSDHVWVEVYSSAQKRWLHCDPCENKCDTPLLYESGWGKKISYVIAVSHDDIQDVTWKYSHSDNHKVVRSRRTLVREEWLLNTIMDLRKKLQIHSGPDRRKMLEERLIAELVEFMSPTKTEVQNEGLGGRESGSLAWRLARQEIRADEVQTPTQLKTTTFAWKITPDISDKYDNAVQFFYDAAADQYFVGRYDKRELQGKGWRSNSFEAKNITRKEENDWKMVYLARSENNLSQDGEISWKFDVEDMPLNINSVQLQIPCATFHPSASIWVAVQTSTGVLRSIPISAFQNDCCIYTFRLKPEVRWFIISCHMSGGAGDIAWQQAQLFRTSLNKNDGSAVTPFLTLTLTKSDERIHEGDGSHTA